MLGPRALWAQGAKGIDAAIRMMAEVLVQESQIRPIDWILFRADRRVKGPVLREYQVPLARR